MTTLESWLIKLLLQLTTVERLNDFLGDPRTVAVLIGCMVAVSGALLGSFLVLRKMSLTSDAISHTVLLGIVVSFMIMTRALHQEPDLSSPWLIIGAALAGVFTVFLTELILKSGLVKADAALGLAFPLLFAIAIIIISRYADDIHLDEDSVMVGQVGLAWANTHSHCLENCEDVVITPEHPQAEIGRRCTNCKPEGEYNPRDPQAVFEEYCFNCGTYSASDAAKAGFIAAPPKMVLFPKSLTVVGLITLLNLVFVTLFYKELKLATFDPTLAATLGFRPGMLHYTLMALVSITAVGAFDAVGAVLVVAFFIVPAAAAYLLTERLSMMLALSAMIGALSALTGWELARGNFLWIYNIDHLLVWLDHHVLDLGGNTEWNTEPAAAMVMMTGFYFMVAWVISPRYGLISTMFRRLFQRRAFAEQMLLVHVCNHQGSPAAHEELSPRTLHEHLKWSKFRVQRVLLRLQMQNLVTLQNGLLALTERGQKRLQQFNRGRAT